MTMRLEGQTKSDIRCVKNKIGWVKKDVEKLKCKADEEECVGDYAERGKILLSDEVKQAAYHKVNPAKTICIITTTDGREVIGTYTKETDEYLALKDAIAKLRAGG
jgi:hypothetical protein